VLELRRRAYGADSYAAAASLMHVGTALAYQGKFEESVRHLTEAVDLASREVGAVNPDVLRMRRDLGAATVHAGRVDEGLAMYDEVVAIVRERDGPESVEYADVLLGRADAALAGGRSVSAAALRPFVERVRAKFPGGSAELAGELQTWAVAALLESDPALAPEAEAAFGEALRYLEGHAFAANPAVSHARCGVQVARAAAGRAPDRVALREALRG
jgi:tetratricopeptide (TPR) repeat protein